jgi:hypothetical protein
MNFRSAVTICATAIAVACTSTSAKAQHDHGDFLVAADADGSGNLLIEYPFDEIPIVSTTASPLPGVFTATDPGFVPGQDEPAESVFELDLGTEVGIEIVAIDADVALQVGMSLLDSAGDTAIIGTHDDPDPEMSSLHQHPEFLLLLLADSPGDFAEGDFSFRLFDNAAGYGDTDIYNLTLSNGYLPAVEEAASAKCMKSVAKAQSRLLARTYGLLSRCLDATKAVELAGKPAAKALSACGLDSSDSKSLVSRLAAEHAKAMDSAAKACGPLSDASEPFTESALSAHLGMGACRAQELAGATYAGARDELAAVLEEALGASTCAVGTCAGGASDGASCSEDADCAAEEAVAEALPCMVASSGGHEDEE